jgi:hypothetical protein
METYPITIIYGCHLITKACQELGKLYGLDSGFLDLLEHKFKKCLASKIEPMHVQIIGDLQVGKQVIHFLIFQHRASMRKNMKQGFEMNYLPIPLFRGFVDLLHDRIWSMLGPQSHVSQMGTIVGNVFPPFFTPSRGNYNPITNMFS